MKFVYNKLIRSCYSIAISWYLLKINILNLQWWVGINCLLGSICITNLL